ncbi:hypothetical protein HON52_03760 [Candidatus Uhrbacteria bacterium]|jgi:hypothetical protein|nr:hypothetical protein [Candidatus Uhrbacteria bacterium]
MLSYRYEGAYKITVDEDSGLVTGVSRGLHSVAVGTIGRTGMDHWACDPGATGQVKAILLHSGVWYVRIDWQNPPQWEGDQGTTGSDTYGFNWLFERHPRTRRLYRFVSDIR